MRDFACPHCGQRLAFENSVCLSCSNGVGFDLEVLDFVVVDRDGTVAGDSSRGICSNLDTAGCNWVVATSGTLCRSCSLAGPAITRWSGGASRGRMRRSRRPGPRGLRPQ